MPEKIFEVIKRNGVTNRKSMAELAEFLVDLDPYDITPAILAHRSIVDLRVGGSIKHRDLLFLRVK